MSSVHISLDMQLYMVAVQVKCSDPERWRAVIAHPGGIGNLMKGAGVEELLGAAYRPLSRRLDRCDRMIQNEGHDSRKVFTLKKALCR